MREVLRPINSLLSIARQSYYRNRLGALGENCIIERGVDLQHPEHISIGDSNRIGRNVTLRANTKRNPGIVIGDAVSILDSALIASNEGKIIIGERSLLGPFCLIYGNGNVTIGSNVLIAAQTSISTVSHYTDRCDIPINEQGTFCDPIVIEDDVWIGMNTVILQGVRIGRGAIIGAGALVNKSIPAWNIAVGTPVKLIGRRKDAPVPKLVEMVGRR